MQSSLLELFLKYFLVLKNIASSNIRQHVEKLSTFWVYLYRQLCPVSDLRETFSVAGPFADKNGYIYIYNLARIRKKKS